MLSSPTSIRLSRTSGVPIYKQIVDQIRFLVEAGQLQDGDRLPSSRMLASNLGVNRNTVARAYRELRDGGLLASKRRGGMVVTGTHEARERARTRERALEILRGAIGEALRLGLSPDEVASLAYHYGLQAESLEVTLAFVECNAERAEYFAREIAERFEAPVSPLVLGEFDPDEAFEVDLVLTTFFHLSEVRRLARPRQVEVVAIVVAPHLRTLARLAQIPPGHRVGVLYSTREQAEAIRDSLLQAGLHDIEVLEEAPSSGQNFDAIIVPSEMPDIRHRLNEHFEIVEFGNVLDEASMRMLQDVINDIRDSKAPATFQPQADRDFAGLSPAHLS